MALELVVAAIIVAGLVLYVLGGGADFGGGVWDLLASGPHRREQRALIEASIGPIWEANHVWLIFVIVLLFTGFPRAFYALGEALFVPFHLALAGITEVYAKSMETLSQSSPTLWTATASIKHP